MTAQAGLAELVRGGNLPRSAVVAAGMSLHAVNVFIAATILPTVVADIGGLRWFAWSTTLYVLASLFGAVACPRLMARPGTRATYRLALALFALGSLTCALAPVMGALLAGRFVQGLGAGTLSALSFTQVRTLFPERLWARAFNIISLAWGVATLGGPAVGGVFAEFHAWRAGFAILAAAAPLMAALVEATLPPEPACPARAPAPSPAPAPRRARAAPLARGNLALLSAAVLAVSVTGSLADPLWNVAGVVAAGFGLALFARREARGPARILPDGACEPARPLGATYLAMALLLLSLTAEIFVPYFLQTLHGLSPLHAGYVSALLSGGWTIGSVVSSGAGLRRARALLFLGPALIAFFLLSLALLMPRAGGPDALVAVMGLCLLGVGLGIGLAWPQLGTRVFAFALEGEHALAAASITTVVMIGNAAGSALAGLVTNMAGLSDPGGAAGAAAAAAWLFALAALPPLAALVLIRRLPTARAAA